MARKPRTKKAMIEYLHEHFRYYTGNSWNLSSSYAANVKLPRIMPRGLDGYDFLQTDEAFFEGRDIITEFCERWKYEWQIHSNGRSNGYLVLYHGGMKPSGYKRYCRYCGQRNFVKNIPEEVVKDGTPEGKCYLYALTHTIWVPAVYPKQSAIAELGLPDERVIEIVQRAKADIKKDGEVGANKCGRCNCEGGMQDYSPTHMTTFFNPSKGIDDEGPDLGSWDIETLKWRVDIVWDFDKTVERVTEAFIDFVRGHNVVEREVMVPKMIYVAVPIGGAPC